MMAGITLTDMYRQKKPYRLDRDTCRADGVVKFPTYYAALREDRYRAKCLENTRGLSAWEARQAEDLRMRLIAAINTGVPVQTLASAVFHRQARMPILEAIWKFLATTATQPLAFVTLMPQNTLFAAKDLSDVNPALLMQRHRNDFDRCGVTAASGFAFFGLDAEFDSNRHGGVWDFGSHGIVAGDKVAAIKNLRSMRKYTNARSHPLEQGLPVSPRVQLKEGLYNLPEPITYCLESWVPHRPTSLKADGTLQRSATKRRIPSPDFQRWLIWMNMWDIKDFILLSNLRPTRTRLQLMHL
jgi:hypothetical protein